MTKAETNTRESIAVRTERKTVLPPLFKVLLHNDHYTTMEFVVEVLESVFRKSGPDAVRIMLNVHEEGIGVAGVYISEIAETKIASVHSHAREQGFPLRCSMEPE